MKNVAFDNIVKIDGLGTFTQDFTEPNFTQRLSKLNLTWPRRTLHLS